MKFCIQLSADYPDKHYGGDRVYADMLEQARLAERSGFESVSVTEHHLMNCLMMPAPLLFAVKIADATSTLNILTSVVVLPLHDMRTYAGEVVVADIFTEGRLMLGVGRGAFAYEMERLGVSMPETQARFNESLEVLQTLLNKEEVSWDGEYYQFDALTIMPRPVRPGGPPIMMAVMNPEGIYHCTKKGFHIQTTPLSGNHQYLVDQVTAFKRGCDELGEKGCDLTLSLSRVAQIANTDSDHKKKVQQAHRYYGRFDNVFKGPGQVDKGMAAELPCNTPIEDLEESLLICSTSEMIDRIGSYAELGVDRLILNPNFGLDANETLESLECFAEEVIPCFDDTNTATV